VLVGYSGGVDSTLLAAAALDALGAAATLAVLGRSPSVPAAQLAAARAVAARLGVPLEEVDTRELDDPRYVANPTTRCYYCKAELWARLAPIARTRGMTLVDGTNADDLADHRPGARAAAEYGVRSPLADCGLGKADVRALSAARGLPTWDQPSAPCLASRLPYGTPVTPARLAQVEAGEAALRRAGVVGDLRVRHHGDLARVELPADQLDAWLAPAGRRALVAALRGAGYARVAVDLAGSAPGRSTCSAGSGRRRDRGGRRRGSRAGRPRAGRSRGRRAAGRRRDSAGGGPRAAGVAARVRAESRLALVSAAAERSPPRRRGRRPSGSHGRTGFTHVALVLDDEG
jgi:uncharacterized protein